MHGMPVGVGCRQGLPLHQVQVRCMPVCSQQCVQQVAFAQSPFSPNPQIMMQALAPSDHGLHPRRRSCRRALWLQRGQILSKTIYHDICSLHSYYIVWNMLTCACDIPPLVCDPSKGCSITGYVSNFCLHNQKKNGMIDPNNRSDPVIKGKRNAIQHFVCHRTSYIT